MLSSGPTVPSISKYSIDISWYNFVPFSNVRTSLDRKYDGIFGEMYGVFRLCGFSIETPKVNEYFAESILFVHQRLQKSNLLQKTKNLITKFFASCILSSCQDSICESSIRILSAEHLAFTRTCSGILLE